MASSPSGCSINYDDITSVAFSNGVELVVATETTTYRFRGQQLVAWRDQLLRQVRSRTTLDSLIDEAVSEETPCIETTEPAPARERSWVDLRWIQSWVCCDAALR